MGRIENTAGIHENLNKEDLIMNKPSKPIEIKLTADDVMKAIDLYINEGKYSKNIDCVEVRKTRSDQWFLIARCE